MSINTTVGKVHLSTPLLLASGLITETPEFFMDAKPFGCSGMVTRSLKKNVPVERQKVPSPRYVVDGHDMMLNCEWGNDKPWQSWRDLWVEQVRNSGSKLILSLSGRDIDSCKYLINAFDRIGVDAFEINVSCAHSGSLHGDLNVNLSHLNKLLGEIRITTQTPIWIKLSFSSILLDMAKKAEKLGADAIVCTNTIGPGLIIDTKTGVPKLGVKNGAGGVSGKAIFPIALRCVYELSRSVQIPIVGVGGICGHDEVLQMMMAGASAVQLYTYPALRGPAVFKSIVHGLQQYIASNPDIRHITDVIGLSHNKRTYHQFSAPRPVVLSKKCTGCKNCSLSCAFQAIDFENSDHGYKKAHINNNCVSCNACIGVCDKNAIYTTYS